MTRLPIQRETAGFLASFVFVCLASVRDVYFGALFQRVSPFDVAVVAFALCALVFLPIAWLRGDGGLRVLLRKPGQLFGVNATAAIAWLSFFVALETIEPLLVQVLFAGVGPASVMWIDRLLGARPTPLSRAERAMHFGLLGTLAVAAAVALGGVSGIGPQAIGTAALGVVLATAAGIAISANTVMCRRLNDAGVQPATLVAVRFVGATVAAALLGAVSTRGLFAPPWPSVAGLMIAAALALIVFPIYVNQVGIALASPVTVRAVLALAPVLIFVLQLLDGRLSPSPYSLVSAILYGVLAIGVTIARGRAIATTRPVSPAHAAATAS